MTFKIGDYVFYKGKQVQVIDRIITRKVKGVFVEYFVQDIMGAEFLANDFEVSENG